MLLWRPDDMQQVLPDIFGVWGRLPTSDLTQSQLRTEFSRLPGLLLTDRGWLPSLSVFKGPPILGSFCAFAPSIQGAGPLWSLLALREPGADDCIDAIRGIARKQSSPSNSHQTILLESLRALAKQPEVARSREQRRKLTTLPLWTSKGWMRDRPVFATSDSVLADGLKDRIPLREPGGDVEQFRSLLSPLRVKEIGCWRGGTPRVDQRHRGRGIYRLLPAGGSAATGGPGEKRA